MSDHICYSNDADRLHCAVCRREMLQFTVSAAQSTFTLTPPKQNYNMIFSNASGQIGALDFNGPEMKFTGNADESAKVFFDWISKAFSRTAYLEKRCEVGSLPKIICLCGSSRFYREYQQAEYDFTTLGYIYLSIGFYPHAAAEMHGEGVGHTPEEKLALDELHKRKIDLADEVFVLNVGGYIGESTRSEIDYAERTGKPVKYLEALRADKEGT